MDGVAGTEKSFIRYKEQCLTCIGKWAVVFMSLSINSAWERRYQKQDFLCYKTFSCLSCFSWTMLNISYQLMLKTYHDVH